jgi:hypothetical protein
VLGGDGLRAFEPGTGCMTWMTFSPPTGVEPVESAAEDCDGVRVTEAIAWPRPRVAGGCDVDEDEGLFGGGVGFVRDEAGLRGGGPRVFVVLPGHGYSNRGRVLAIQRGVCISRAMRRALRGRRERDYVW